MQCFINHYLHILYNCLVLLVLLPKTHKEFIENSGFKFQFLSQVILFAFCAGTNKLLNIVTKSHEFWSFLSLTFFAAVSDLSAPFTSRGNPLGTYVKYNPPKTQKHITSIYILFFLLFIHFKDLIACFPKMFMLQYPQIQPFVKTFMRCVYIFKKKKKRGGASPSRHINPHFLRHVHKNVCNCPYVFYTYIYTFIYKIHFKSVGYLFNWS